MTNIRMKIAAGATVLGLGALAGFAVGSNPSADPQSASATPAKPKVQTEVVRRTVHRREKAKDTKPAPAANPDPAASSSPPAAAPASGGAVPLAVDSPPAAEIVRSPASPEPISTGTSGGSGGSEYEDEGEHVSGESAESEGEDD